MSKHFVYDAQQTRFLRCFLRCIRRCILRCFEEICRRLWAFFLSLAATRPYSYSAHALEINSKAQWREFVPILVWNFGYGIFGTAQWCECASNLIKINAFLPSLHEQDGRAYLLQISRIWSKLLRFQNGRIDRGRIARNLRIPLRCSCRWFERNLRIPLRCMRWCGWFVVADSNEICAFRPDVRDVCVSQQKLWPLISADLAQDSRADHIYLIFPALSHIGRLG